MIISGEIQTLWQYKDQADLLRSTYGTTDLYSTSFNGLDQYLGGGYGRENGYEILTLFGRSGIGKSSVALNLVASPIKSGVKVGLLVLEDDMADVYLRLEKIMGAEHIEQNPNIICLNQADLTKPWSLDSLLHQIEGWYTDLGVDLILLDHLQFAFEGATQLKGENEFNNQRVFIQKLNGLMKKVKKTIILISHVSKDSNKKGFDKIVGSSGIAQGSTKIIEVDREENILSIEMHKSRFTKVNYNAFALAIDGVKLKEYSENIN